MVRDDLQEARAGAIGAVLFCACMRYGEVGESSRLVGWYEGEYDVLSSEEVYVAVAAHRTACGLQRDLFAEEAGVTQPSLFPAPPYPAHLYGGLPPHMPADTSRDAARAMAAPATRIGQDVLAKIQEYGGLTIDELAVLRRTTPNAVSPRIAELRGLGQIADSGRRRKTRRGRRAIVWRSTEGVSVRRT